MMSYAAAFHATLQLARARAPQPDAAYRYVGTVSTCPFSYRARTLQRACYEGPRRSRFNCARFQMWRAGNNARALRAAHTRT